MTPNGLHADSSKLNHRWRDGLIDWLVDLSNEGNLRPTTMWMAVNMIDRFMGIRSISGDKIPLLGVSALFIAAKYEEMEYQPVHKFMSLTDFVYDGKEIVNGERALLKTVGYSLSKFCSPYGWMQRISRAGSFDAQTQALSDYLVHVTLFDPRFVTVKISLKAAIAIYCARRMLGRKDHWVSLPASY